MQNLTLNMQYRFRSPQLKYTPYHNHEQMMHLYWNLRMILRRQELVAESRIAVTRVVSVGYLFRILPIASSQFENCRTLHLCLREIHLSILLQHAEYRP
jgi:hypothetical protein